MNNKIYNGFLGVENNKDYGDKKATFFFLRL